MSTITLPNIRVGSDLQVRVRLKDGGVAIDWSTLQNIKACIYSDAQRALAGRCSISIDAEDSTLLVCNYAANKPQYLGANRVVISVKYLGETKTYDKPAFTFVRWTDDQAGEQITIDDPDVDVEIEVEDISSSILQEAVDAAFAGAERANEAAAAAEHMVDIHTGPEGKSAYEVAVEEGYTGTEEEWLASLVGPQGPQGIQGETGEAAGFGTASAALTEDGGNPGVTVATSGSDTAKNFAFTFKNLKGDKGDKGDQGNTGSSVDYPYELVNNCTTNDATKGLAASQGVALAGEVSQLEAEVTDSLFPEIDTEIEKENTLTGKFITSNGSLSDHVSYNVNIYSLSGVSNVKVFALGAVDALVLYAFYSSNDITSGNLVELGSNSSSGSYNEIVAVPSGATYIAVTIKVDQEQAIISKVEKGDAFEEIKNAAYDYIPQNVAVNNTITGKYIRLSDGNISTYADYNVLVYNVHGLKNVTIKSIDSLTSETIAAYAFYFNTPSSATVLQIGPAATANYEYSVNIPEGAEYLAVTKRSIQTTTVSSSIPALISDKLQDEIDAIEDAVEDAVERIDTYHPNFPISSVMTADRTDSGKFLKQNGDEDSHANYSVLVYDLTGISKVNIYGKNGNSVVRAYNFYNSDTISSATLVSAGPEMSTNYNYNVDVPAGATFLACTKFHTQTLSVSKFTPEQVTNEVKVENGNTVTLCTPSGNKKLYMVIGPTDPGVGNGLIDFRYWGYVPLGGDLESTPTELYHSSSDCFGPFRIKALSNIDGDDVDSDNFTGGSHQYNNNITGSTPTARLGNVEIRVDGVRVDSFRGAFHEFEMIWEAFVQANNTRKSDGTGREVLKEIITLKYIGGEFLCRTELVPLEDISIYRWYGYQTCGYNPGDPPSIGDYWYYVNATNRGLNNEKSGNKDAVGMVAWTDDFHQEMWIDTSIDLGKRIFVTDNIDNGIFRSGAKAYFMIVDFANTILTNNRYILDGKYIFKLK